MFLRAFAPSALVLTVKFELRKIQLVQREKVWLSPLTSHPSSPRVKFNSDPVLCGKHCVYYENQFCMLNLENNCQAGPFRQGEETRPGVQFLVSLSQTLFPGVLKYLFYLASVYSSLYKYIRYVKLFYLLAERILRQECIATK